MLSSHPLSTALPFLGSLSQFLPPGLSDLGMRAVLKEDNGLTLGFVTLSVNHPFRPFKY